MAATYYLLLTEYGQAKIASLLAGETIDLSGGFVAIGDANGQPYLPESRLDETDLVNECARVPIQSVANVGVVTTVIATIESTIGGFNFHELAILDETEQAVYLGNYHGQYKPILTEGAGGEIELHLDLGTAGIGPVFLQVDPTVVTANKAWVIANFVRITTFDAYVIAAAIARDQGDSAALANAKTYTDSVDIARAIDTQNKLNVEAYIRDLAVSNEISDRIAGDSYLQSLISLLGGKVGAVGGTDLQTQVNNLAAASATSSVAGDGTWAVFTIPAGSGRSLIVQLAILPAAFSNAFQTWYFPVHFPNAILSFQATVSGNQSKWIRSQNPSQDSIDWFVDEGGSQGIYAMAIGF